MPRRKWAEVEKEKDDDVTLDGVSRKLSTQPRQGSAVLRDPVLLPLFDYAARQIQLFSYWGSRFINFHLLRLLWNVEKDGFPAKIDKTYISRCFMVVAAGFKGKHELERTTNPDGVVKAILESAKLWEAASGQPAGLKARLSGMGGMVTSAVREYSESFDNYQIYGFCQHWAYVVRITYDDATQKISEMVVRKLCEFVRKHQFKGTVTCRSAGHFFFFLRPHAHSQQLREEHADAVLKEKKIEAPC
jgi:hypothetical protein